MAYIAPRSLEESGRADEDILVSQKRPSILTFLNWNYIHKVCEN